MEYCKICGNEYNPIKFKEHRKTKSHKYWSKIDKILEDNWGLIEFLN